MNRERLLLPLLGIITFAIAAVGLHLLWQAANPNIQADNWHFLQTTIIPYLNGDFEFADLYRLRGAGDHAQPIHRLITLVHVSLFDLDYRFEALAGYVFLLCCIFLILRDYLRISPRGNLVYLLLTSTAIFLVCITPLNWRAYTWPLVMLGYMPVCAGVAYALLLHKLTAQNTAPGRWAMLGLYLCTLLLLIIGDDSGMIIVAVCMVIVIAFRVQESTLRQALAPVAVMLIGLLSYKVFKGQLVSYGGKPNGPPVVAEALSYIQTNPSVFIEAALRPLASTVITKSESKEMFGDNADLAFYSAGFFFLLLQCIAWWTIFRQRMLRITWLPAMLMLYSYALILGIVVYRVPQFGLEYLNSTRYLRSYFPAVWGSLFVVFWRANIALANLKWATGKRIAAACLAVALITIHINYFNLAFEELPKSVRFQNNQYKLLHRLHDAGNDEDVICKARLRVCRMQAKRRTALLNTLAKEELNVFSPHLVEHFENRIR